MKRPLLLAALLLFPSSVLAVEFPERIRGDLVEHMTNLINVSRIQQSLPPLEYHDDIERVAQGHANDSAEVFDSTDVNTREATYLGHVSSDGRALNARYRDAKVDTGWGYAENVGYWTRNPYGNLLEASIFGLSLMHEGMIAEVPPNDSHRKNILGDFTHVGIGLSLDNELDSDPNTLFFVSNFSRYIGEEEERKRRTLLSLIPTSPRSLIGSLLPSHGGPFLDVRPDHEYITAISAMKQRDIIKGHPTGEFLPDATVNRAELLKMLMDVQGFSPIGMEFNACFTDIANQWFAPYVCVAKRKGWVTGYSDNSFRPGQAVNRAEAVTLAARFLEPLQKTGALKAFEDVPESAWFSTPVQTLQRSNLLPFQGNQFQPEQGMKRGEVADMLYRVMREQGDIPE